LGGKPLTLREVGADLKLTAERVRQIQQTALDKLRLQSACGASQGLPLRVGA
jgi:DNA-directed RNA polymerase sigma subunit (sigma70/sigma32)